jgi:ABC-2 type transport system permease protein
MVPVLRNVFTKTLWDERRSLLWWSLGLAAVVFLYVVPYQSYLDSGSLDVNTDNGLYQTLGIEEITSPAGYLGATAFGLLGSLLLIIAVTATGARAIAGDEEEGLLDLLLSRPVSRAALVLERFAALVARTAALGCVVWVSVVAAAAIGGLGIGAGRLAAATVGLTLLGLNFGALALAVGAATGRRGLALGLAGMLAVGAYLLNTLAPQIGAIEPLQRLSPFYHYEGQDLLRGGFDPALLAVQVVVPLALLAVALRTFDRRDLGV